MFVLASCTSSLSLLSHLVLIQLLAVLCSLVRISSVLFDNSRLTLADRRSGLKTDLGLLSNGSIWGWTVCVILVAFLGKFVSCGLTAKVCGMDWRESGAVGSLMACKGLVEVSRIGTRRCGAMLMRLGRQLIVLNIGLSAGILNSEVFAMFVTM